MILAGQLLLVDSTRDDRIERCRIAPGTVRIDDDRIIEVIEGPLPKHFDYGGPESLIAPGFIDAHLHLPQFDMIGAHGMSLLRWLDEVTFPAEAKWANVTFAQGMTYRALRQLLGHGTTAICAYATVHFEAAIAALEVAASIGFRGVIGQVLMDGGAPTELCREPARLLNEAQQLGERFPATGRIAAAVTPRFAVSCSEQLLQGAGVLSWEQSSLIQTHLAETEDECNAVANLFDGRSYVEVYQEAGLLNERAVLGHGIHLDEMDRGMLYQNSATVVHCPTANSFLRSGTMNRAALLRDNVPLAIGSDIGAGYERSMVRVARAMIEAAAVIGDVIPEPATAWHAITAGNADTLGWDDAGRLTVGGAADIVVIEPDIPWLSMATDPLNNLMFAWDDRWIRQTFLRGVAQW